jgi:hypothetical protein
MVGSVACADAGGGLVHRVGYPPEPWAWTPWEFADQGVFTGRWDDPDGTWRTLYVGDSRLACYLKVLAPMRPDPRLAEELADINEDPDDAVLYPTLGNGLLPRTWASTRRVGQGRLSGWYALPADKETLTTLRARFLTMAVRLELPDVDASAVRVSAPRQFTQSVAAWLYLQTGPDGAPLSGVRFDSRHGDGLTLWAVFERPGDEPVSAQLSELTSESVDPSDPELVEAMRLHRLAWALNETTPAL